MQIVTQPAELQALCERLSQHSWLTFDTEFLRNDTYRPILCLLQIASADEAAIVDPLALTDLQPLWALLLNPNITKVFHAGSQDLEIIFQATGQLPSNLFDTQIAASVCGFNHQTGYGALVKNVLDIDLPKAFARTDWSRRPLNQDELDYALADVTHLRDVYHWLNQELEKLGRHHWIQRELDALSDPSRYQIDPANAWQRVKGIARLKPHQRAIARELCQWREALAQNENRARGRIIKDDQILDLAKRQPQDMASLQRMQGFHPNLIKRHSQALLDCIGRAEITDVDRIDHRKPSPLTLGQQLLAETLLAILRYEALQQDISPETLGGKKQVELLLKGEGPLLKGWRYQAVGEKLESICHGKTVLRVSSSELRLEASE